MATTSLSSLGIHDILVREGIHPPITLRENGGEVYPGYPVTVEGHTYPDSAKLDGIGDPVAGVAGLNANQDIDTVYADNSEYPVYITGSGAIVWVYHSLKGGSVQVGDLLVAQAVDDTGHVETLEKALTDFIADGSAGTILATQIKHVFSLLGRALETHASSGTTTPIKCILSI